MNVLYTEKCATVFLKYYRKLLMTYWGNITLNDKEVTNVNKKNGGDTTPNYLHTSRNI